MKNGYTISPNGRAFALEILSWVLILSTLFSLAVAWVAFIDQEPTTKSLITAAALFCVGVGLNLISQLLQIRTLLSERG